jgi:predicted permease
MTGVEILSSTEVASEFAFNWIACIIGFVIIFLPVAIRLGFREEKLVALLVMLGSATTISCYVMAKNMGHEGTLTSSVIMLTTLLCAFTLTMWIFLLKTCGLL